MARLTKEGPQQRLALFSLPAGALARPCAKSQRRLRGRWGLEMAAMAARARKRATRRATRTARTHTHGPAAAHTGPGPKSGV